MKTALVLLLAYTLIFPAYCLAQTEESFALVDWGDNQVVILDFSGNVLFEKDFDGIGCCYFVAPYLDGWLVKGCQECFNCTSDNWFIWKLTPDGSIERTYPNVGPGPFYTGITDGNFISGNVYTGVIDLYNENGSIIDSTNVWEEENGWPYEYSRLGDIAGLVNGGFVVPPQGGWSSVGQLYTPYLYYYDNDLNLLNKVDITSVDVRLLNLTGLSDGGFVGTCADHGTGLDVEYLCWFDSEGTFIDKTDVTGDLPFRDYMNVFITGLSDGRAMVTVWGREKVWIYYPPGFGEFFLASQPIELDLSGAGITSIGGIAGNIFFESDCEGNFDCDGDMDGTDAAAFKIDFGRVSTNNPCTGSEPCNGDFDCDTDVDGSDAARFKSNFGRSSFNDPCPACTVGDWCVYP